MRFARATACLLLIAVMSSNVHAGETSFSLTGIWNRIWGISDAPKVTKQQEDALWRRNVSTGSQDLTPAQQRALAELGPGGKADLNRIVKMLGITEADLEKARQKIGDDPSKIDIDAIYRQQLKGREAGLQGLFNMISDPKTLRGGKIFKTNKTAESPLSQAEVIELLE